MTFSYISPDCPFEPHFVQVHGSQIHYIDEGLGEPILLLLGNPTWSISRFFYKVKSQPGL